MSKMSRMKNRRI